MIYESWDVNGNDILKKLGECLYDSKKESFFIGLQHKIKDEILELFKTIISALPKEICSKLLLKYKSSVQVT